MSVPVVCVLLLTIALSESAGASDRTSLDAAVDVYSGEAVDLESARVIDDDGRVFDSDRADFRFTLSGDPADRLALVPNSRAGVAVARAHRDTVDEKGEAAEQFVPHPVSIFGPFASDDVVMLRTSNGVNYRVDNIRIESAEQGKRVRFDYKLVPSRASLDFLLVASLAMLVLAVFAHRNRFAVRRVTR